MIIILFLVAFIVIFPVLGAVIKGLFVAAHVAGTHAKPSSRYHVETLFEALERQSREYQENQER